MKRQKIWNNQCHWQIIM